MAVSRLEFAIDDFLFGFSESYEQVARALTRTYPFKMSERVDLLISILIEVKELRTQPIFFDGFLDLNWLGFALDELFEERNSIAHGASFFRETRDDRTLFHFYRYSREAKNRYQRVEYRISNYGLAHLTERAHVLRRYLENLLRFIQLGEGWEQDYKVQAEICDNWYLLEKLEIAKRDAETGRLHIPNTGSA